ncbi:hypothetical protein [Thermocrinis sp.]|jgi:uncharacterized protein YggE|uniref:hypothetical protein n=1 Tax=Thermocrinis sp. TaxID=2024383 RepID=UPI003C10DF23
MRLLFLLLSLWALSFAQDNPLRVFVSLTQSAQIAPDIYILTLNISAEADKEVKALSILGRVDRELSQLGLPYSGGNYWVDRKCFMEKNTQKCKGFRAQAFYQFRLKDVKDQDLILQKLAQMEGISFSIQGTQWIVSANAQEAKKQELMFSLLDKASAFTTEISKKLKRECQIESISYDGPLLYLPIYGEARGMSAPQPTKDLQTITVFMRLSLVCK